MTDNFLEMSIKDRYDALEQGRELTGRPAHLLEKDVWVVWALKALFDSPGLTDLTFKGGTSLSKAYKVINRFSEDIDLTYDIRKLIPDLIQGGAVLPRNRSQAKKWTKQIKGRLANWIKDTAQPAVQAALDHEGIVGAQLELDRSESNKLLLRYPHVNKGTGYVAPVVTLEFGGRATGEPNSRMSVECDIASQFTNVLFPTASPVVMSIGRTFWEKATAAHTFCSKGSLKGERYARHWHDLAAIWCSPHSNTIVADRDVATAVAHNKSHFFVEKDIQGNDIDYHAAVSGHLKITPVGGFRAALAEDYNTMIAEGILLDDSVTFDELMNVCAEIETVVNGIPSLPI